MKKYKQLKKNPAALIAFLLLLTSGFLFPLFGTDFFGESFTNKNSVVVNLIRETFTSQISLNSSFGVFQVLLVLSFIIVTLLYLLNGFGLIYNRYSRYASFLTILYFILGLLTYNSLNEKYATSLFGLQISSITMGAGIYFVPFIGILYFFFARSINKGIKI